MKSLNAYTASYIKIIILGFGLCCICMGLQAESISALGRVLPATGVINVWGPSGERIEKIHKQTGEWVEADELLVTLAGKERWAKEIEAAESLVSDAKEMLEVEQRLQAVRLKGMENDYKNAAERLQRLQTGNNRAVVSPQVIEERQQAAETTKNALELGKIQKEKSILNLEQNVRAQESNLASVREMAQSTEIRSSVKGKILITRLHPGEVLGKKELMKIADVSQMIVSAEVYESDVGKVKVGNQATIDSVVFSAPLTGKVISVGNMLYKNTVDTLDPRSLTNSRVVEVLISLDDPKPVENLVYLQVDVSISF